MAESSGVPQAGEWAADGRSFYEDITICVPIPIGMSDLGRRIVQRQAEVAALAAIWGLSEGAGLRCPPWPDGIRQPG